MQTGGHGDSGPADELGGLASAQLSPELAPAEQMLAGEALVPAVEEAAGALR
ncbi:MAG: hypothetical protein J4F50_12520 [Acidimicrobiia bacterium]|nr:hypothetical protein [Acidimicrobiia bacterium]